MAIAFDNINDSGFLGGGTATFSHTVATGNPFLLVDVWLGPFNTITSVTYGGVAMVLQGTPQQLLFDFIATYMLVGGTLPTGANNVVVVTTGSNRLQVMATSYTGVSQTGQPDGVQSQGGTTGNGPTNYSAEITTTADNCWMHAIFVMAATFNTVLGTQRFVNIAIGNNNYAVYDTNGPTHPAGVTDLTVWGSGNGPVVSINSVAVSFSPATTSTVHLGAILLSQI